MNIEGHTNQTVTAIWRHYEANRKDPHRPHLGGSQIGHACERALWYLFRWADSENHVGRMLRLFETGNLQEPRLVADLRGIGVEVWETDDQGQQYNYALFGGHFGLSLDGVGLGFPEAPKTPHVLEFKTASEKSFNKMAKNGLLVANEQYYAQVQIGMLLADLDRAAFFMVNKNNDDIYMERVRLDKDYAKGLVEKAERVIFANTPPAKIADSDDWWQCRFCRFRFVCQRKGIPEVNCRTCAHSTPERDGVWSCQINGTCDAVCDRHLFRPDMMPWEVEDASTEHVQYKDGPINQRNSQELRDEIGNRK